MREIAEFIAVVTRHNSQNANGTGHLYKDELALARVLEPQEEGTSNNWARLSWHADEAALRSSEV